MTAASITPLLEAFLQARESEFSMIPEERREALRDVAAWIRHCHEHNRTASLVFICTHNSRRSHLSQIWAQVAAYRYGVPRIETFSGGTEVTAMNSRVVDSLHRSGLVVDAETPADPNPRFLVKYAANMAPLVCYSKIHNEPPNPSQNFCAIMTCAHADEVCPVVPACELRAAIRYEDPKAADGSSREAAVYDERSSQICREMLYLMQLAQTQARP